MENITTYTVEVYTDGSKIVNSVGAAGVIFVNGKLVKQIKFKMHGKCSNNKAEKIGILRLQNNWKNYRREKIMRHGLLYTLTAK